MARSSNVGGTIYLSELIRESYYEKVRSLDEYIQHVRNGMTLTEFVNAIFGDVTFSGTEIRKRDLVLQLTSDRISLENWLFLRSILRNLAHLTDRRHAEEYALDIALGWVSEEIFKQEIENQSGMPSCVTLVGVDSQREYQSLGIRAKADFKVLKNGHNIFIDLFVDYLGTWANNGGMDLKPGKIKHFNDGTLDYVLGLDARNRNVYLIGPGAIEGLHATSNSAMGGIQTVRVPLNEPIMTAVIYSSL